MRMDSLKPVFVLDLFPEERKGLIDLLKQLPGEDWNRPTVCPGWSVKDIADHLLGDDLGILSRKRDGYSPPSPEGAASLEDWETLVAFINHSNAAWVEATQRVSPALLIELLEFTGEATFQHFSTLDPLALGEPVSWAGPEPAPTWLDTAREYTERWLHQQQIRDAVERPGFKQPRFFHPVLDTFVRALPRTYHEITAAPATSIVLTITGEAGGTWGLEYTGGAWQLGANPRGEPAASVRFDAETAWRLFTRGIRPETARERAHLDGDTALGLKLLDTVSILA